MMKLVFISNGEYPDQHAAAIRHSTLAKGLTEAGHQVTFLLLTRQNWATPTLQYNGATYICLNTYKGNNKIINKIYTITATFKLKQWLTNEHKKQGIDAVVVFSTDLLSLRVSLQQTKKLGIKVFHERTELPYALGKQTAQKQKDLQIYQSKYLPGFDGIFLISNKLMDYMAAFNSNTQKLLTVVDPAFFSTSVPSPYPFPYIGYCGTISGNKDGVPILIEAFAQIAPQFPELKLVLVGNNNKAAIQDTLLAIDKYQLENRVVFTGLIERDMMPVILCNAQILVVAKPDNEQNSGNFPIKIGEYLATGVPIVVTSVGEIPLFIKDGESGYLAQPGSATDFAHKMTQALSHPDAAKEAGQRGKAIALNQFHYQIQARIMANYIAQKIKS